MGSSRLYYKGSMGHADMFHLKAIEIIAGSLRGAVENTPAGWEGMALGRYIGMGFSNVGLGIVYSMAHSLGAVYDTPHGVANAILLSTVMKYNAPYTGEKYKEIARAMGVAGVDQISQEEYRKAAVDAVKQLSADAGIPAGLAEIGTAVMKGVFPIAYITAEGWHLFCEVLNYIKAEK